MRITDIIKVTSGEACTCGATQWFYCDCCLIVAEYLIERDTDLDQERWTTEMVQEFVTKNHPGCGFIF